MRWPRAQAWAAWLAAAFLAAFITAPLGLALRSPPPAVAPPVPLSPAITVSSKSEVPRLQSELETLASAFADPVGIAVIDLTDGKTAAVTGEQDFPQQSVSKLWVALALLDGADHDRWSLDDPVVMRDEDLSVFYQPIAKEYGPDGYRTTLDDLMARALIDSDNAAADKLVRFLGGAAAIQAVLDAKGLAGIRAGGEERHLQSAIAGLRWRNAYGHGKSFKIDRENLPEEVRDAAVARYMANMPDRGTPMGVARALAALQAGRLLKPQSTRRLIEVMSRSTTGPNRLKGGLPAGWKIAHKTGTGQDWRDKVVGYNDVGVITAPDGRAYAVAVLVGRSITRMPARFALMQGVSAAVVRQWEADTGRVAGPPANEAAPAR